MIGTTGDTLAVDPLGVDVGSHQLCRFRFIYLRVLSKPIGKLYLIGLLRLLERKQVLLDLVRHFIDRTAHLCQFNLDLL